ncbi:hypothetical protein DR_1023 [Deinococcus radiodurans R1 = ATCC 13939 = DSM 20539]|uniref:Uncharacterized protein n=1 Tax=Deinococcus radiodurans (strain ATCC 13939 / DSM 20539 / JCM 16871 / CCUG 27074 / LMG 4051 / NBRC 15346 / NCIMB 9279 / VKM B-1422 / R1) TaxID=243230 RepID=Q9RVK4_DEIRA|nr:hypothetical protein DR_1023 [Deinococcus radiodurans R1 = ATCC 13939 = DSM 20539]
MGRAGDRSAEPIEAEAEATDPEDTMPEVIVTEVPEVSEEPLPTDDLVQIEEAQLDAASDLPDAALPEEPEAAPPVAEAPALSFESVPLDLPPDATLVISAQPGDVLVMTEESDLMEASSEAQAVEDAALPPAEQDLALPEEPSSTEPSPARPRKDKASGGEIAKPAKAIARKRTTRK